MEKLRNRIDVKLVSNRKYHLKWISISTTNKHAYIEMYILESNKVLMYGLHFDYIRNKYGNN